jgi:DNA topoisomerase-1
MLGRQGILLSAIKKAGSFKILSIGRVQGPALKIIVDREREIDNFKPEKYWSANALKDGYEFKHPKDIFDQSQIEKFEKVKKVIATTKKSEQSIPPGVPFDLTTLQREAYRVHKITPSQVLEIAQRLYLDGLISYPRTSSQKIPDAIEPKKILKKLQGHFLEAKNAKRNAPVEGKKSDPAHPSIYPTGDYKNLTGSDEKLFLLIVKRFIACFSDDCKTSNKKINLDAIDEKGNVLIYNIQERKKIFEDEDEESKKEEEENGKDGKINFVASAVSVIDKGWTEFYPYKIEEREIPDFNGEVNIDEIKIEEKETQPPNRYTPTSLLSLLERKNLGTKATRSSIIDTLFERGYLDGRSIKATPLGLHLIESLEKYSPVIIDENLTRQLEEHMQEIQDSEKDLEGKKEKLVKRAKEIIEEIAKEFKEEEENIGKHLTLGLNNLRKEQQEQNELIECPTCKKGKLRIMYSKKSKRYFVACSAYPECKQTYSLPANYLIKKADKICSEDNFPKLLGIKKGKRPWEFCFNPDCPEEKRKREEWAKKKEKFSS